VNVHVRPYHSLDADTLYAVYVEAVQIGAADHYTLAQRMAWAPDQPMPDDWPDQLAAMDTWVAEVDGDIAGFMAVRPDGYIDLAFVRPRWMGRNVAQALYERILERALSKGLNRLSTHANHLARPFLSAMAGGSTIQNKQTGTVRCWNALPCPLNWERPHEYTD